MAGLLWKRGTTLGQGGFGVVSLASTSNALFHGVILPSLITLKSCNYSASQSLKEVEILQMFKHSAYIVHCFGAMSLLKIMSIFTTYCSSMLQEEALPIVFRTAIHCWSLKLRNTRRMFF
ncbi:hypothetical protein RDI58_015664 [Solanum bulbocastanum]|uniref:Uncharacterized protein n=1 Tax=Solanum bulbocastanum TaxID=147425 RepID=A0AAN8TFV7_SOLBU